MSAVATTARAIAGGRKGTSAASIVVDGVASGESGVEGEASVDGGAGAPGNGLGTWATGAPAAPPVAHADVSSINSRACRAIVTALYRRNPFVAYVYGVITLTVGQPSGIMGLGYGAGTPSERVVRASEGRSLAEGNYALVPGKSGGDRGTRPRDKDRPVQLQASVGHSPASLRQDQAPVRLRPVLPQQHLCPGQSHVPILF